MADRSVVLDIAPINRQRMTITVVGDTRLVCHNWSDKAKKMMLDKQMKKAAQAKEAKDPAQDFADSLYPMGDGRYGFPAIAFKNAAVSACRFVSDIKMTEARGAFHVLGDLIPVQGDDPQMREDMVRVGMGTADIRYRGEFINWRCTLDILYNANVLSPEQIINLFNNAGFGVGVGEHRPEKDGSWGLFHVEGGAV